MRNPGYKVETEKGKRGRTKNADHFVNGKQIVYLEDDKGNAIRDAQGKQVILLSNRRTLKIIGFID